MLVTISKHRSSLTFTDVTALHKTVATFKKMFPNDRTLQAVSDAHIAPSLTDFMSDRRVIQVLPAVSKVSSTTTFTAAQPCENAVAIAIIDVVSMVLDYVGLNVDADEAMNRAILRLLDGQDTLDRLSRPLCNLNVADSPAKKAKAIFDIANVAYRESMFSAVFGAIQSRMHLWDWIISGVATVAHMEALVLTDGAAFIAEIMPNATAVACVLSDSARAVQASFLTQTTR